MSIDYGVNLGKTGDAAWKANVSGVSDMDTLSAAAFSLELYAYSETSGKEIHSGSMDIYCARALWQLLHSFSIVRDANVEESERFVEVSSESMLQLLTQANDLGVDHVKTLLSKLPKPEVIAAVSNALDTVSLEDLLVACCHRRFRSECRNLELLLELEAEGDFLERLGNSSDLSRYAAGKPETVFQRWVEQNLWAFGLDHGRRIDGHSVGIDSEADVIVETVDGYLDLVELKLPSANLLLYDKSHDCYYPSADLSKALGQCVEYLGALENHRHQLQDKYSTRIVAPRVRLIAGRTAQCVQKELDALRRFNGELGAITVSSYDNLLSDARAVTERYQDADTSLTAAGVSV